MSRVNRSREAARRDDAARAGPASSGFDSSITGRDGGVVNGDANGNGIWPRVNRVLRRLRVHREPLSLLIDAIVIVLAWNATYLFRLGFDRWITARPPYDTGVLAGVVLLWVVVLWALRVPRGMWRFVGFGDARRLVLACLVAGGLAAAGVFALGLSGVPRAVLGLHPVMVLMGWVLVRMLYRMVYEHMRAALRGAREAPRRAIVLGAGEAARRLVAGIQGQGWSVLGLLDDDPAKQGARVAGVPVVGTLAQLRDVVAQRSATHVVMAIPSLRGTRRLEVFDLAAQARVPVLTVPSSTQLEEGAQTTSLRDIEAEDLLGREPVRLEEHDERGMGAVLEGRTVLVTGAGGSIGSELCVQVARFMPQRLVLLELSEFALYTVTQTLAERFPALAVTPLIGDVKDLPQLRSITRTWRPAVVFHAAAYKHVPLMEEGANLLACLRNNVLGTRHVALAAAEAMCERFVLVSTDKAVNPTSVMGASKRAAEQCVSMLAAQHPRTRFVAVRFGNVLESSGSVIPRFKEQIARGGPVTVTHPDVIRYFMTIPEAARLVLQAAAVGDSGQVLVLDMGEPVKIVDLARRLIRLAGRNEAEIGIQISGLRPGEKLYEELLADAESTLPTSVDRLRIARLQPVEPGPIEDLIRVLELALDRDGADDTRLLQSALRRAVIDYGPEVRSFSSPRSARFS